MAEVDELRQEARRNTRSRFEQWAKNPTCDANTLSAVHNIRLDAAARAAGLAPSFGQSPFAIARGNRFEAGLFRDGAARLREALERKSCLPQDSAGFLDLRLRMNGGAHLITVDQALEHTEQWLQRIAAGDAAESVVAGPMVRIPRGVILPEALLIIDGVIVTASASGRPCLTVVEVKVFADRGGHTDRKQLATARAQAGLYRHALELALGALGLSELIEVTPKGILVFTWPGSNSPSIRAGEDLTYQVIRAQRGFQRLEEIAGSVVRGDDFASDDPTLIGRVLDAGTHYTEACLSFCDLAPRCHQRALEADDSVVLGDDVRRLLGETTISRAIELINGDVPGDDRERDLQRQLGLI
ncbi:hypothetical protein [Mycobacterium sp. 23]|uniref:hypothetical protein n=1 Tax=Mycobacterium sp. 23 TaxID=3400424 RepID=UPI003AB0F03F